MIGNDKMNRLFDIIHSNGQLHPLTKEGRAEVGKIYVIKTYSKYEICKILKKDERISDCTFVETLSISEDKNIWNFVFAFKYYKHRLATRKEEMLFKMITSHKEKNNKKWNI